MYNNILQYVIWVVPLWIAFKYRMLFFSSSSNGFISGSSLLWGAYVIWGAAVAQNVAGCDVEWRSGVPITILVTALIPILVGDAIRPAVGATCALIVAGMYVRAQEESPCRAATAFGGICVGVLTLLAQELTLVRRIVGLGGDELGGGVLGVLG